MWRVLEMDSVVSIIVPVYNVKDYLDRCIDSLINQTYPDLEIILIDDGSTDGSGELCDIWEALDKRIKVIHQSNEGVSSARNCGLLQASGEWITFVDPDDWIESNTFEFVLGRYGDVDLISWNFAEYCEGKKRVVSFTQREFVAHDKAEVDKLNKYVFAGEDERGVPFQMGMKNICNRMVRRRILRDNDLYFNETLKNHEDFLFAIEMCEYVNAVAIVDMPFYCRYMRGNSASRSFNENIINNNTEAYTEMKRFIDQFHPGDGWYENAAKQYYTGWFMQMLKMYLFHKKSGLSFAEAHAKGKQLAASEPYKDAFANTLRHSSHAKKLFCFFARHGWFLAISIYCKLENLRKR